jgi:ketosteroid isomerase-like protein
MLPSLDVERAVDRQRHERRLSLGASGPRPRDLFTTRREDPMSNENVALIRSAYGAYSRGGVVALLQLVDPDLRWTYLDPTLEDPEPQVCHGRHEFQTALERQAEQGLKAELEEVAAVGDRVMVVVRTPGIDEFRARKADDRRYALFTVRDGRIVAMRDCRDRVEAMAAAAVE